MKWLTIILSLYLLGLSLWPCADEALSPAGKEGSTVLTPLNAPESGTSHQDHDLCTPLCICTCCAATTTVVPQFEYTLIPPAETIVVSVAAFAYAPIHWADSLSAIWQPPKVG